MDKRLYLIDAYAMIFRGYYALIRTPRRTSTGIDTSAIFGFTNSLIELIRREHPSHLAVVFDVGEATMRLGDFAEYKANRSETPEAIKLAIPYIHRILEAMHIPILGVPGYEADDVIGSLSCQGEKAGYDVFMVTPDKDFAQLVTDKVKIYKPSNKGSDIEILGVEEVKAKYQVQHPKQVIDILAMMGDAVDNIPGLEGVGEKTAKKFIKEYGSIENLLANTHTLKGKLREKVENSADRGILSKKLATILCDAPIDFHEDKFRVETPDFEKVKEVFDEIEFRRLYENLQRLFNPSEAPALSSKELPDRPLDLFSDFDALEEKPSEKLRNQKESHKLYQMLTEPRMMNVLVRNLCQKQAVAFDTETTSLNDLEAQLVGMSFCYQKDFAYYVPVNQENLSEIIEIFRPFFESETVMKIAHNLKFDFKILLNAGIELKGPCFDTMIAHYLLHPEGRHGMDYLSELYLKYTPISLESLIGKKGKNQLRFERLSLEVQTQYAAEDADITFQLYEIFSPQLLEQGLAKIFNEIEMPLVKVLARMERAGIRLDTDWLKKESKELENDLHNLEKNIYELAGKEFNINSPKQLGEILFDELKLDAKAKKTKTGQYSTSEDILQNLLDKHPIIAHILQYRTYQKLKSTYVDALPTQIESTTGRVHTNFAQTVAATGRLSSLNPNLQNIPIRTPRGQQIRGAFIPEEGWTLISADYSQIELRLIAQMSQETQMIQAFRGGEDIHTSTAAKVFNIPIQEVTKTQRSQAKTVNFGIIYGVSAYGLARQTDLSRVQAGEMIKAYFQTYPQLKSYMHHQVEEAREKGYVETLLGRRRYLPDINSANFTVKGHAERNAVNAPIQGTAADVIKLAMIRIDQRLRDEGWRMRMLLQVHDELVFECPPEELEKATQLIQHEMQNALQMDVPLDVEVGKGKNWLEAH